MNEPQEYENFYLLVERSGRGSQAVVLESPAGIGRSVFRPPYSDDELEEILARLAVPDRDIGSAGSPRETVEAIGKRLFEALFSGQVGALWRESRAWVEAAGKGLRLRLRFRDAPRFESWPWELLFDPSQRSFLALSVRTPIVRYLPIGSASLLSEPPLKILVAIARPSGYAALDADRELGRLHEALGPWKKRGWLVLEQLERGTLEELLKRLLKPFQILHFVGHGRFDSKKREGGLILENEAGGARVVTGTKLGAILSAQKALRLVVLNACEGALTSKDDPWAGVAQALVGCGIPAVIAMRSRISDPAAVTFAEHFYGALGRNLPVDGALADARRALFARPESLEWTAPVLYTRSSDCRLFHFPEPSPVPEPSPELVSPWKNIRPLIGRVPWPAWVAASVLSMVGALYPFINSVPKAEPKAAPADPNLTYAAKNPPECPSPPNITMAFVKVPPDSFSTSDKPRREIPITQPFCIGRFEVTQAQWKKIMGSNPSGHRGDALPVEKVLWEEVQEFLTRLNARMPGAHFRLPANAQWEYAAGAGTAGPSSFKGNPEDLSRYGNCGNHGSTIQVGSLAPNPWGIFDMYGNVAEWVADEPSDSPAGAPPVKHVHRGGGFRSSAASCSSVNRRPIQNYHYNDTGFRIIRDLAKK